MPLREELARSGAWLFRWRSYLPIILLALVLAQMPHFTYLGGSRRVDFVWEMICLSVATLGLVVRVLVVGYAPRGTSGRTTRSPEATEAEHDRHVLRRQTSVVRGQPISR